MAVVYRHIRLDSNQPFYIGIGRNENRAYELIGRSKHWHAVVNKHGYKVHIMMDDLTWNEAQQKEREFIQLYGRKDLGLGTLVNMTDGGDGSLGRTQSKETIEKRINTRKKNGKFGWSKSQTEKYVASRRENGSYNFDEKARANMALAQVGRKHNPETIAKLRGRKMTEEQILKSVTTRKANKLKKLNGEL